MRSFASFHPLVLFLYYIFVVFITVFMMHPIILACSFIGSVTFFFMLENRRQFMRDIGFYALVFLLIVVTNPIFVHQGETILFFYNDHPITLEAILYGGVIGTMLVSVIFWSKAYSKIMTSDKFIYLFGRAIPKLSLVLAMALKFIPLFKVQIKKVNAAQKTLGLYTKDSMVDRLFSGIRIFNSIVTWSLENAIFQADSMKARGYGLKGRTNFSVFSWKKRDIFVLLFITSLFVVIMFGYVQDYFQVFYYPSFSILSMEISHISLFIIVCLMMTFPFIFEVKEQLHWKLLQSKMSTSPIQMQVKE